MKRIFLCLMIAALLCNSLGKAETRGDAHLVEDAQEVDGRALQGLKIGIDPGHQAHANTQQESIAPGSSETKAKVASGTRGVATETPEYQVNLEVSLLLRDLLTALGAEVKMTREENDVDISNQERAIMMNEWGADFVVRIHCNGSSDHTASGAGTYVRKTGTAAQESEELGRCLLNAICEATGAKKTGVYKRDTYTGLNWSTVPCVLVEMGFLTNAEEDRRLTDPEYQRLLVYGMAQGMLEYANKTKTEQ